MRQQLENLLVRHNARFRVIEHVTEGRSELIAQIRGNDPSLSAKAMLMKVTLKTKETIHVLCVLSGNRQLDNKAIKSVLNAKSISFEADVLGVTGCVVGAVPPMVLNESIRLLVDDFFTTLPEDQEIFFNAGELTSSIALNISDYLRITQPEIAHISKVPAAEAYSEEDLTVSIAGCKL